MYEKILAKQKEFEETHVKVRDDAMYEWFSSKGIETLKDYSDMGTKLEYNVTADGIDVLIITKSLLMLPEMESSLLELLLKAGTCSVEALSENKLSIKLWYRGWKWLEKN